ncbi:MAG: hypothetical protein K8T91_20385 [Planctomycetes bacterium]|nr:hypothetical protein [Planctomycetota bacterium]
MPACYQIRFADGTPDVEWFGLRGFYYEFLDGTQIGLRPTIAWCCNCQQFIDAEWIQSLEEITNELAELNDPTSLRASLFTSNEPPFDESPYIERMAKLYMEAKDEATRRIEWRRVRHSPPRCLICGSTDIRFPADDQTIKIPGRGSAVVECTGMCSTDFCNWFYTPEGVRIPRETQPSYWHFPGEER